MPLPTSPAPLASARMSIVIAATAGGVIGDRGGMPWRLSSDLKRFKAITMGGTLVMGRKTFESIGRPLPGRRTIVITRNPSWQFAGVDVATTVSGTLTMLAGESQAFVVGGAEIYRLFFDRCDQIFLTRVLADLDGDTRIDLPLEDFTQVESEAIPAGPRDEYPTEFIRLVHKKFLRK